MKPTLRISGMVLPIILGTTGWSQAQEAWLVSSRSVVEEAEVVWLSVSLGETFPFSARPIDLPAVRGFVDQHGGEITEIHDFAPEDGSLSVRMPIQGTGAHVLGCELRPAVRMLDAGAMPHAAPLSTSAWPADGRGLPDTTEGPVRVRMVQFAKCILDVESTGEAGGFDSPIGHRLEIVPLSDPCRWQSDSIVEVRVLLDGHPWPDVPLIVGREGLGPGERLGEARTDSEGVAKLRLARPGHGFVRAELIRPGNGLANYAWECLRATLTFRAQGTTNIDGQVRSIKAAHGSISPWAVLGYRMGLRAMDDLSNRMEGEALVTTCRVPPGAPFEGIADGIRAAAEATVGGSNLRVEAADSSGIGRVFESANSDGAISFRPREAVLAELRGLAADDRDALALRLLTIPDEEMFEQTRIEAVSEGAVSERVKAPARLDRARSQRLVGLAESLRQACASR